MTPVYTELAGWQTDTSGLKSSRALPPEALVYTQRLEELLQVHFAKVSVGAERSQILTL